MRTIDYPDVTIIERDKSPQLPMTLKTKGKVFAMLYGMESGVFMVVVLDDKYAASIKQTYPEICPSNFPREANCYQLPVDGAFKEKRSVYSILNVSREFVNGIVGAQAADIKERAARKTARGDSANRGNTGNIKFN